MLRARCAPPVLFRGWPNFVAALVASLARWGVWAHCELALETARLDAAVCVSDLVERGLLGHARLDGLIGRQLEEPPLFD